MTAPAASSPCFAKRSALAGPLYGATAHATRLIRPALSPARDIFSKQPPRPFTLSQVARDRDPLSTDSGSTLLEPSHPPLGLSAFWRRHVRKDVHVPVFTRGRRENAGGCSSCRIRGTACETPTGTGSSPRPCHACSKARELLIRNLG